MISATEALELLDSYGYNDGIGAHVGIWVDDTTLSVSVHTEDEGSVTYRWRLEEAD